VVDTVLIDHARASVVPFGRSRLASPFRDPDSIILKGPVVLYVGIGYLETVSAGARIYFDPTGIGHQYLGPDVTIDHVWPVGFVSSPVRIGIMQVEPQHWPSGYALCGTEVSK